jgi:hypothetical protein
VFFAGARAKMGRRLRRKITKVAHIKFARGLKAVSVFA